MSQKTVKLDAIKIGKRAREIALESAKSVESISIGDNNDWLKDAMIFLSIYQSVMEEVIEQSKKTQE
jgi:hypothetical protein